MNLSNKTIRLIKNGKLRLLEIQFHSGGFFEAFADSRCEFIGIHPNYIYEIEETSNNDYYKCKITFQDNNSIIISSHLRNLLNKILTVVDYPGRDSSKWTKRIRKKTREIMDSFDG